MKRLLILGFVLLMSTSAIALSSNITALRVAGNSSIPESEILAAVFSKVGENLSEDKVKSDLRSIYALGYFKDVKSDYDDYQAGIRITYRVVENPLLKKINLEGITVFNTNDIYSMLALKAGRLLNYKFLREDIAAINDLYKTKGYTLARVVDVATTKDEATFKVIEGVVEGISLEGNDQTKDYVIYREFKTKAGKVFNEDVFAKDLRRVFNLGFFTEVNPAFEPGSTPDKMQIVIKIKEARTNTINFGGGYGERDGWFGFADLSVNNLVGTGQGLMLKGQAGQQLTTYQFKYSNPWFMPDKFGDRTSMTYRLWNTTGVDMFLTDQDEMRVGWDATLGKTLKDEFTSSFSLGTERFTPRGTATFEPYLSNFVGVALAYDSRDIWMNPTKGVFHTISLREGWKFANTQVTTFTKVNADFNVYKPLFPQQVLAFHLGGGFGLGDIPLGELFYSGGPSSVRGYSLSEIRKGVRKLIFNIEYRYTFNDSFQAVVFYDWGDAWYQGFPALGDFMSGFGSGVRLNTPMGPIRLDYGIAGGRNFSEGVLHFSIGQAF